MYEMENESYSKVLIMLNNIFLINKIVMLFVLTAFKNNDRMKKRIMQMITEKDTYSTPFQGFATFKAPV